MGFTTVTQDGAILTVTIDRQERLNALHSPAHFELSAIFDTFERDPGLRVAIVTGAGQKAFCAGNDLKFQAEGGTLERPATGFAGLTKAYRPDEADHRGHQRPGVRRRVRDRLEL
jgi:enoyl-CoA hydratase/carnithine racemase